MNAELLPFFQPRGIVVVGASTSPDKLGYGVARNLVASGFTGSIHLVGQRTGELFGHPIYDSVLRVPDPVDLAVLVVPANTAPDALRTCGTRGIHSCIIESAGFREAGPEGAALEQQCLDVAHSFGMRILGPNCIGTIDTHLPVDTSFLQPPMPPTGAIAFASHSGAFCAAIIDWSRNQGFGFSRIASLGNQADISETDMLPVLGSDDNTRVIALYMEGVSNGLRFVREAREVALRKPIVALKVGRFEAGQKAAASHTAALAGSDVAFDAAFSRAGVFRAASAEQMFDWARALQDCPLPKGRHVAVLTDAGGPGVIAADALEAQGLRLATLSADTRQQLTSQLPAAASVHNPVDMLASASPDQYAACLEIMLNDQGVDSILVILPPPPMFSAEAVAHALIPIIDAAQKPVVIALLGSELTAGALARFTLARIPAYPFPERAASALGVLTRRADLLANAPAVASSTVRPFHVEAAPGMPAVDLVSAYGIQALPLSLARSADEAADIARQIGFPVVMKLEAAGVAHKSDLGGVLLGLQTLDQVRNGYAQLIEIAEARLHGKSIEGVRLQRQAPPGQEVITGAVRDPQFGPLVMFGSGGVEVEGLGDVAFALAPINEAEADGLMRRTWAGRRLDGFRNIPPADKSAVRDVLVRLSWLAHDHPEINELEINPLRVFQQGALALDVRSKTISLGPTQSRG